MNPDRHVVLGVSGSIAAVKAPEIVRALVDRGFPVRCVLTKSGREFVSPLSLATFSGHPVVDEMFDPDAYTMPHLQLAEGASVLVIAPASATLIARCAHGLAEDMVSLIYVTTTAPVIMAPAMHPTMWEHPSTRENVRLLRERGVQFVGPYVGPLADNTHGDGRMAEPAAIAQAVEACLSKEKS